MLFRRTTLPPPLPPSKLLLGVSSHPSIGRSARADKWYVAPLSSSVTDIWADAVLLSETGLFMISARQMQSFSASIRCVLARTSTPATAPHARKSAYDSSRDLSSVGGDVSGLMDIQGTRSAFRPGLGMMILAAATPPCHCRIATASLSQEP